MTDDYTVVSWDQRGCGRTYYHNAETDPDNSTVTFEQAEEDLNALVDYVCDRFGQDKVIIMGHSYGSLLGSQYVLDYPEKVSHYIGIGQEVEEYFDVITAPRKDMYLLDGCGHSPQGQLPEEFARAVKDFLGR